MNPAFFLVMALLRTAEPPAPIPLTQNVPEDVSLTAAGAVVFVLSESLLKPVIAPQACNFCERSLDGTDTLNAFDAWGRGIRAPAKNQLAPDAVSTALGFGVVPLTVAGLEWLFVSRAKSPKAAVLDALDIAEAVVAAGVLNETVKSLVGRERPFVHVLETPAKRMTSAPLDNNVSFYSGHTSLAFSLVAATATVAELRGYEKSYLVWAVGLPLATTVGVLRMVADRHYLTDVLTGAALGTLIGMGVPRLFHPRKALQGVSLSLSAGPGSLVLSGRY